MKFQSAAVAALICAVTATPVPIGAPLEATRVEARQDGGETSNDLTNGICRAVTLIFARGSTEPGNMVSLESHSVQLCLKLTPVG
jgi:cutinase